MITKLRLKNFTAFDELEIEFSPGINILIGENGTGKTHLMKAAYVLCSPGDPDIGVNPDVFLMNKLRRVFKPYENFLVEMHRHGSGNTSSIQAEIHEGSNNGNTNISFTSLTKQMNQNSMSDYFNPTTHPVFIPAKEVLSFMIGFVALYEKYNLEFDETYKDICQILSLPTARIEKLTETDSWAMEKIEKVCGGKFIIEAFRVIFQAKDNTIYGVNMVAEGFRKLGMLSRLIENKSIEPGISGPLFWDEPESNMNPTVMRLMVDILLKLSRNGQQIILATHDYVLLKWFDLLMAKDKNNQVRFHSLYRDSASGSIKVTSVDSYQQLTDTSIAATFSALYDNEIDRAFAGEKR